MAAPGSEAVTFASDGETLAADLYGSLPAARAAILVHGQAWDAERWRPFAPRFVKRGVPALALDLRGYGRSSGKTNRYRPGKPWTPILDLRAAKAFLRERGARELALVGCSMGGHAVLGSSLEGDAECVVSVSAPVVPMDDEISRRVRGRKLYLCATRDRAAAAVRASFAVLEVPKELRFFEGSEHSIAMFRAPYGREVIEALVEFVCRRA